MECRGRLFVLEIEVCRSRGCIKNKRHSRTRSKLGCGVRGTAKRSADGNVVDCGLQARLCDWKTPVVYSDFHLVQPFCERKVVHGSPLTDLVIAPAQAKAKRCEPITTNRITEHAKIERSQAIIDRSTRGQQRRHGRRGRTSKVI